MLIQTLGTPTPCRTVIVPACERECDIGSTDIEALALFQIKLRDTLDFTVDFTQWLAANGGATLSAATFAVASGSPQTPVLTGQAHTASGKTAVIVTPASTPAAVIGDAYYLDVTATIAAIAATAPDQLSLLSRTIVRRIHVVVVAG